MNVMQMPLDFSAPAARESDPDTSHDAAARAALTANRGRKMALEVLRQNVGGLTDHELSELTGWRLNSMNKRRGELRDAGLVVDTGRRRRTPSGSTAIVWAAV